MTQTNVVLQAGLLARKGDAHPASISGLEALTPTDSGTPKIINIDQTMRHQPVSEQPEVSVHRSQ